MREILKTALFSALALSLLSSHGWAQDGAMATPVAYTQPATASFNTASPSASYGPLNVGPYPQGAACCDLTPTPTVIPCIKPVTSCCSQNGRLGVPPLLTPIRYDMPPVGRAVGRPLFGRWTGF